MGNRYVCKLCDRLVISQAVTFTAPNLIINLPAGSYGDGCEYCIVVAQSIPETTTITAPVVVTIGDGTETYPLVNQCCAQVTACALRTRTRYKVRVATSATGAASRCWAVGAVLLPTICLPLTARRRLPPALKEVRVWQ